MEKTCNFTKNEILCRFVYGTILLRPLINYIYIIYIIFSAHLFQRTGLGAASDIFWGVIFGRHGDIDPPLSTMDS